MKRAWHIGMYAVRPSWKQAHFFPSTATSDCTYANLMMDANGLYPDGFHPVMPLRTPDGVGRAKRISRAESNKPVKYYYIDFGISVHMPADRPRAVVGVDGLDREVPELSRDVPYDPFKVDIFILGNMFKHEMYEVRHRNWPKSNTDDCGGRNTPMSGS